VVKQPCAVLFLTEKKNKAEDGGYEERVNFKGGKAGGGADEQRNVEGRVGDRGIRKQCSLEADLRGKKRRGVVEKDCRRISILNQRRKSAARLL